MVGRWQLVVDSPSVVGSRSSVVAPCSVPEVPPPGEHHRHPVLVGRGDHLRVPHRPAGLDDGGRGTQASDECPATPHMCHRAVYALQVLSRKSA
jgi:hypothetical protein